MIILKEVVLFLEFLFQGYCGFVYFSSLLEKKRKTYIILIAFLISAIIEYILYSLDIAALNILLYIILSVIISMLCYNSYIGTCILHSFILAGIIAVSEMLSIPIVNTIMSDNYIETHFYRSELIIASLSKMILFIVCKIVEQFAEKETNKTKSIWLFVLPLSSLVCLIGIYYLSYNLTIYESDIIVSICSIALLFSNIIVFLVHENSVIVANKIRQLNLSEQKKEMDYEYYKILQENYNNSRVIVHDIKHHINTIRAMASTKDSDSIIQYIDSLLKQKYFIGGQHITGNKILDIIIFQKSKECDDKNILFRFRHNNINFDFVDEPDICCIVSNILDNATESAEKSNEKIIDCELYTNNSKDLYFIEVNNSCDSIPKQKNNKFISLKEDKEHHGIGMLSVETTVRKYSGDINCEYIEDKHMFRTIIMIHK